MNSPLFATSVAAPTGDATGTSVTLCPSNVPLVLFPVRLETRFFTLDNGTTELRIRVYPDKIHVDTHQPELTTEERTYGAEYWKQDWAAGDNTAARGDAWRVLADRFGAPRAAWIARVLRPTNPQQPGVAPIFPTLPPVGIGGEDSWRKTPVAQLLPDYWTATIHSGGAVALTTTSGAVRRPLAVGPNPRAAALDVPTDAAVRAGEQLAIDPDMKWMVDFVEAEAAGMGMRVIVPPALLATGIESLVVFGVSKSVAPAASAAKLADLLDAHHYTDGLEFLRFGTPTNNTEDRRAGYNSQDPDHVRSFTAEVLADPVNAPNAVSLGTALGLAPDRITSTLGRLCQARGNHDRDARDMNTALWQAGWGYFLHNMVGFETGLTIASIDWAREHFRSHVRAGGPLPTLRVGAQPYGVLPVTSQGLWAPDAGETVAPQEAWLKTLLANMRENVWRPVLNRVARVGLRQPPYGPDPDADLADVMRMDGVSHGHHARPVLGRHYIDNLYAFSAYATGQESEYENSAVTAQRQAEISARLLTKLGLQTQTRLPRLARVFHEDSYYNVTAPLVQAGEISPERMLDPNFIKALLDLPTIDDLLKARPAAGLSDPSKTMLQMLLRHSMLREIATAAARIAAVKGPETLETLLRDLELIDVVDNPLINYVIQPVQKPAHWRRQLDRPASDVAGAETIRKFLENKANHGTGEAKALGEFRTSLSHLQELDTQSLHYLMQSTLDLSSHRLDAWITSFATKRLSLMTQAGSPGHYVGAYGWVENVTQAPEPTVVPLASLPAGEPGRLVKPAKDSGFIHAPSVTHAATAALLRNAHLGPSGIPAADGPFAIDLSSRRVREASRLLDGIRQGQPLGALLGYRLERRLHELGYDRFIAPLRKAAPLVLRAREENTLPTEAIAANNVVDGLVLMQRWRAEPPVWLSQVLSLANANELAIVEKELDGVHDAIDGLSDALTAEVGYQLARGNTTRLAATLSAIADGNAPPPELEVARTPRTGNAITHRLLVLIPANFQPALGWVGYSSSLFANSERALSAWVSKLLGDSSKIRCTVELFDETTDLAIQTIAFPLSELLLASLSFIYGIDDASDDAASKASLSYIEQFVLYNAKRRTGGFGEKTNIRIQHARPGTLAAGETTLFDAIEQARAIRRLLENARGARPEDVCPPERPGQGVIDLVDLEARILRGENSLNAAHKALQASLAKTATTAEDLRKNIVALGAYGIRPGIPCIAVGDTPDIRAALQRQAAAMLQSSGPRLEQAMALRLRTAATEQRARCDQLLEYGAMVFGPKFKLLPNFTCDTASATELKNALTASTQQQGGNPLAVHGWFAQCARVNETASHMAACLRGAEVLGTGERLALSVAQLPFDSTERWVGLPPLADKEIPQSKLSLAVQSSSAINTSGPLSGLFIDEWVEIIPSTKETTAVTFQFDPPNSVAPQNILIAVPPIPGQDWTTETLRRVLMETLDLAKIRAVDPSLLGAAAQYLPGIYLAFNAADDAVSTDFNALTL